MKKNKKQKSLENILSYEELSILKGGILADRIRNVNTVPSCNCDYKDSCGLTNKNTVGSCSCTCI